MDPAVLIFLLYVMIAHELVSGWVQHRKQSGKTRPRTGAPPRTRVRMCGGVRRSSSQSQRELRKSGRIVRKA
uniref:Secreted protein n=1 Tax=Knipowitschia caucasica TaxID=637954 RepID=A0AAV2IWI8_KNICA